jgi:uncharacterized membrane protein
MVVRKKMGSLSNAKIFGGIGALLMLIGVIPQTFGILGLIGFIMVFIAVKIIADQSKEKDIFNNYLYSFILVIIAVVVAGAILLMTFTSVGGIQFFMDLQNLAMSNPADPMVIFDAIAPVLTGAIAALVIGWIILIVAVIYLRKSFNKIAEVTNVKWFATTGLLYLIGAFTLIIVIGALILLIAVILEIVAFFSLPDQLPAKAA